MIVNCKTGYGNKFLPKQIRESRVMVDGREIRNVWYLDTDNGVVNTYDVYGDGKLRGNCFGALSRMIVGSVHLAPAEAGR